MKRRAHHEGSVYQLADGRWCAAISLGRDAKGRRKRRRVFAATQAKALARLRALQNQAAAGGLVDPTKMTLGDLLDRWLSTTVKTSLKENTYQSYEITCRVHIKPRFLGGMLLAKIRPDHVQALYAELAREEISPRTIKNVHLVLNLALGQAKRWRFIASNPCVDVEAPRRKRRKMSAWTAADAASFLDAAQQDRLWALYVLAIDAGLRQGELLALKWADIDLDARTVAVQRSLVEVRGKISEDEPKEEESVRSVAIGKASVDALRIHRRSMLAEGNAAAEYVFCAPEGGPIHKSNLRTRSFYPLLEIADVPKIRFHDLRHTSATLLLAEGINPKIIQERLGHSDVRITLQTYAHALPHLQHEAAEKLDAALQRARRPK